MVYENEIMEISEMELNLYVLYLILLVLYNRGLSVL